MTDEPWTKEEVLELRFMYESGRSHNQIAKRLGKTRASVSGKIARLRAIRAALDKDVSRLALRLEPSLPKLKFLERPDP